MHVPVGQVVCVNLLVLDGHETYLQDGCDPVADLVQAQSWVVPSLLSEERLGVATPLFFQADPLFHFLEHVYDHPHVLERWVVRTYPVPGLDHELTYQDVAHLCRVSVQLVQG